MRLNKPKRPAGAHRDGSFGGGGGGEGVRAVAMRKARLRDGQLEHTVALARAGEGEHCYSLTEELEQGRQVGQRQLAQHAAHFKDVPHISNRIRLRPP